MNDLLLPEEESDNQQFISDYEDCTENHKNFADKPFTIPELPIETIDKMFLGKNIGNTNDTYEQDYHLQGMLAFYHHPEIRIIGKKTTMMKIDMQLLGRSIQALYN